MRDKYIEAWDAQNTITASTTITRGKDPELFKFLRNAESRSGAAKELLRLALAERRKADAKNTCTD